MRQDPPELRVGRNIQLSGIVGNAVDTDKQISVDFALFLRIIKRNDIGIIIVVEVLAVNIEQVLIRAKNIVQFTQVIAFLLCLLFQPLTGGLLFWAGYR